MASLTWWTWVWVNSGSWWWIGRPGVLRFMGSQRVGHNWATELNQTGILSWDLVCLLSSYRTMYPWTCRLAGHLGIIKHTGLKSWLPSGLLKCRVGVSPLLENTRINPGENHESTPHKSHFKYVFREIRGRGVIFSRSFCFCWLIPESGLTLQVWIYALSIHSQFNILCQWCIPLKAEFFNF